jgi:hypothetical protein
MATKTTVALEDDIDGGPADETVRFRLGGADYEIDLSTANADRLRAELAPFIEFARKGGSGPRRRPPRPAAARRRSADVRAWAKAKGIQITDRGRIPGSIIKQYEAAAGED